MRVSRPLSLLGRQVRICKRLWCCGRGSSPLLIQVRFGFSKAFRANSVADAAGRRGAGHEAAVRLAHSLAPGALDNQFFPKQVRNHEASSRINCCLSICRARLLIERLAFRSSNLCVGRE